MERTLHIVGRNSSEIFLLRYPRSLLNFCDFDFTNFAEKAIELCDEALKTGELDFDEVTELRDSIKGAHAYIEHNIRTVYDKIVIDCWIDYVCRRDSVGTAGLWNRFIACKTAFEKAVFVRLCEYRYNKAINEWLNLVRVQDYAQSKVLFLFPQDISSVEEAAARRNYFDLMLSVTAGEMGCRVEDLGVTKVFSVGRLPTAPFMFPTISKELVKNLVSDYDDSEDYSENDSYESQADQIAMDAFAHMKAGLDDEAAGRNVTRRELKSSPIKVYMPYGLKAVIDLEIDALIESGGWLSRCKRCGRYFVRDNEHSEEYCSLYAGPGKKTCLEIYQMENPKTRISPEMEEECAEITDEVYGRVGNGLLSLKEYESWKKYLEALKQKVNNNEIPVKELSDFINYSRSMDISKSQPVEIPKKEEPKEEPQQQIQQPQDPSQPKERVVKPFVPERISRSDINGKQSAAAIPFKEEEEAEPEEKRTKNDGFFTSPSVERRKSIAHIIRAEKMINNVNSNRRNAGLPAGAEAVSLPDFSANGRRGEGFGAETIPAYRPPEFMQFPAKQPEPQFEQVQNNFKENEEVNSAFHVANESEVRMEEKYVSDYPEETEQWVRPNSWQNRSLSKRKPKQPEPEPEVREYRQPSWDFSEREERRYDEGGYRESEEKADYNNYSGREEFVEEPEIIPTEQKPVQQPETPKPKVIRKNAAAITAYGRAAGKVFASLPGFNRTIRPEPEEAEKEPFKDIGSIFDVLERSETDMSGEVKPISAKEITEEPKRMKASKESEEINKSVPERQTEELPEQNYKDLTNDSIENKSVALKSDEVPSGIWRNDRRLFGSEQTDSEFNMLKEKKRGSRSSKTQRLFNAIMREPEDNPTIRKKR